MAKSKKDRQRTEAKRRKRTLELISKDENAMESEIPDLPIDEIDDAPAQVDNNPPAAWRQKPLFPLFDIKEYVGVAWNINLRILIILKDMSSK